MSYKQWNKNKVPTQQLNEHQIPFQINSGFAVPFLESIKLKDKALNYNNCHNCTVSNLNNIDLEHVKLYM